MYKIISESFLFNLKMILKHSVRSIYLFYTKPLGSKFRSNLRFRVQEEYYE